MTNTRSSWLACLVGAVLVLSLTGAAWSQDDPPGRVGRVAELQGGVLWFDHERGQWVEAERNRPVTTGDRLSTAPEGRVELRVGSTVLRLGGAAELEVLRLDDERLSFQLHSGNLALRVRSREVAGEIDIVTAEARLQPQRSGHYRFDRIDDTTQAGSWRGDLAVEGTAGVVIATGQRAELWRQGPRGELRHAWTSLPNDDFSRWVSRDDGRDERTASTRFVSPEMTGAEDLDRAGRWDRHPDHGAIWFPIEVRSGWAPYRYGRWAWVRPWGWTWVDEAPWGFAPFHYGRWLSWNGRWGWVPGVVVPRPVFAPALVAWVGGPQWGVSVNVRGPVVGWVPLAPREIFVPSYRHTPRHSDRINNLPYRGEYGGAHGGGHSSGHSGAYGPQRPPWVPGPRGYGNQSVPGAVTVVPRDTLDRRAGVGREAAEWRDRHRGADLVSSSPLAATQPPSGPQAAPPVPRGEPMGPARPPHLRESRGAPPTLVPPLVPTPVPMQEGLPPQGDVMFGPSRPRAGVPAQAEPRLDRGERADDRADRVERIDRTDRSERTDRWERVERFKRAGPTAPAGRTAPAVPATPAAPMMVPQAGPPAAPPQPASQRPPSPMPQVQPMPQAAPQPAPQPAPQVTGPASPAAPPAAAAAPPPRASPGERERGRERDAAAGDGERRRGNGTGRDTESQR